MTAVLIHEINESTGTLKSYWSCDGQVWLQVCQGGWMLQSHDDVTGALAHQEQQRESESNGRANEQREA